MSMRHPLRILSVEDDPKDADLIEDLLATEGIVCDITRVENQADFMASLKQGGVDLILADYSLPSFDGISALKLAIKICPDVPFIFVSGTLGEEVAIEALKIGATDYVLKTSLSRLVPSVQRALRESTQKAERKRAEEALRQNQTYLAEAQRLSHTGSFGWKPSTGGVIWSEETFRIFQYDRTTTPTVELVLQRVHPEDAALVKQTIERASQDGQNFEHEYRLLMPDGSVKHVHVLARALNDESGSVGFVGAVMDVTAAKQAGKALRESEAYLAEAQRLSHTGSWASTPAMGEIRYFSEECYRVVGFDPHGGLPRYETFFNRIHPDDQAKLREAVETAGREKVEFELDYRVLHPGGDVRDIHVVGHPVFSPSGDLVEFVGTVIDVTDRKRAEGLRDGESRILEMIVRDAPLEEILENLVRVVEAQFTGLLCSVLLLDEDGQHARHGAAPSLPKPYAAAIDGLCIGPKAGSSGTAMYRREAVVVTDILRDPLWEEYRGVAEPYGLRACWSTPILAHSGKPLGSFAMYYCEPRSPNPSETHALEMATHLAGIAIERKLTQEQLQRSEAYLAEAQKLTHMGSWVWAVAERRALHLSEEWYRVYGFDPNEGIPDWNKPVQRMHPDDRARWQQVFDRAISEKSDYEAEYRILLPDGAVRHIHSVGHPVLDASGKLVQFVGSSSDVTERKQAEEALRQAQADLARINRVTTMGELTASLAHEVNQPIAAAVTDANTCLRWLARDQPDLEEARAAASRVVKDAARAADIMSRIRSLFKKEISQRELVDVNDIIRGMIELLRSEATRYSISMRTELSEDLPQIVGDRVQLQQVTMNLIINSIDAMKDVDGTREIAVTSQRAENEQLQVSVSDTGIGLPSQRADQIFNAFFTTKTHGTGMGLRISRSIVESHGGRLWAAPNSPRGARLAFTLPTNEGPK
jgi:PAS domain S-box-containing protein